MGSISLKRGRWSLFNIGLSNRRASTVVVILRDEEKAAFDRTEDKIDPDSRPTDLTAKERD
jgi:hypothetical protein